MKTNVEVSKTIPISADLAWGTIRTGGDLEKWLPFITACRLDGDRRYCSMAGGGEVTETILSADDASRTVHYRVDEHPLPVGTVLSSIRVVAAGKGCEVIWSSEIEGSDEGVKIVAPMLEGLYSQGIEALAAHHRQMA